MGAYLSRSSSNVEELDLPLDATFRYPPKTGNFFASHFIMGGEKFETMQPESYLFGENKDLNFLGSKPFDVPYKVSTKGQPLKALRCLVNIRKDSLRLVKIPRLMGKQAYKVDGQHNTDPEIPSEDGSFLYNVEFTFDADCPCSITIYYNATEEVYNKNVIYSPEKPRNASDTVHFNAGSNQQFCLPSHCIDPAELSKNTVDWSKGYMKIPIVIQVCADAGPTVVGHSHITYAEFYKPSDTSWSVRTVKQKQAIDGVCYLIQEIFGIENKDSIEDDDDDDDNDDDEEDDSSDCVVCLSELRDTLILPCRHLCLCSNCANQLRYQQSGCPICRQSFRALLRIRAVRKKGTGVKITRHRHGSNDSENEEEDKIPVPSGYEVVPLIEAIKGKKPLNNKDASSTSSDVPTPSTSRDEISIVDETGKSTIGVEEIAIVTDESDAEEHSVPDMMFKERKISETSLQNFVSGNDNVDEEHVFEEINLPGTPIDDPPAEKGEGKANVKEFVKKNNKTTEKFNEIVPDTITEPEIVDPSIPVEV